MKRQQLELSAFSGGTPVPAGAIPDPEFADRPADDGARILLRMKGGGLVAHVIAGEHVRLGQPLIGFDPAVPLQHGKASAAILGIESGRAHPIARCASSAGTPAKTARDATMEPRASPSRIGGLHAATPGFLPEIKTLVRRLNLVDCQAAARSVLQKPSSVAVRSHARNTWPWRDSVA
jgi:hypothetical protein